MYPRNASSPPPINVGAVALTADGTIQTTGVSVRVKTGTGAWGTGAGTLTCDSTSGTWDYVPTQAETDGETFQISIYKTNCQPSSVTVATTASPTAGYAGLDWGAVTRPTTTVGLSGTTIKAVTDAVALPSSASINITGNITGNLSGSVGSVTGAVGSVTGNVGGSVASVTGAVGSVTGNVGGSVASVVGNVGGNVTGSVGSVATGGITSASFAAGAIDAAAIATDAIGSAELAASAVTEIASGVRTELATELGRLDGAISTRLATAGYTAPDNAGIVAIKAKTDNLPASPAAVSDIPTAVQVADAVLGRSVATVQATAAEWSLCTLVLAALESSIVGSTWTIYRTDGATPHATKTITTDAAAEPITGVA